MATGPEHYAEAEKLLKQADSWENADTGWKAHMSGEERIARRTADLAAALVHAQLANAAATALNDADPNGGGMPEDDYGAWRKVAGLPRN
jgi:hypothetical protein